MRDPVLAVVIAIVFLCIAAAVWIFNLAAIDRENWQRFVEDHHCKITAHMSGDVSTGFGAGVSANGKFGTGLVTVTTPDKTAFLCDDGITYLR